MILLADGNDIFRMTMTRQLAELGYVTHSVNNGLDVIECALNGAYRLVFLDVKLPKLDGLKAAMKIRQLCAAQSKPHLPIVAVTGVADREKCLLAGIDDFLPKPVDMDDLRVITDRWIPQSELDFVDQISPVLATILKQRRLDLHLSLDGLCELSDVSKKRLVSLESGDEGFSIHHLIKIGLAMGVAIADLIEAAEFQIKQDD